MKIKALILISIIFLGFFLYREYKKNDSFKKNSECTNSKKTLEVTLSKSSWNYYSIDHSFYSPIKNSCLYGVYAIRNRGDANWDAYMVWDNASSKPLFYRDTTYTNNQDIKAIYDDAIIYLKGDGSMHYSEKDWGN